YHMARVLPHVERYAEELRASPGDARLGPPTLSVGRIEGGTSVNTVPDLCRVEVDRRLLPREDPAAAPGHLMEYLKRHVEGGIAYECSEPWLMAPALPAEGSEDLVRKLGEAINAVVGSHEVLAVPYGTDAST